MASKYQPVFDDYHALLEEYNQQKQVQKVMIELITALCAEVDRTSNPDRIDEFFISLSKEVIP